MQVKNDGKRLLCVSLVWAGLEEREKKHMRMGAESGVGKSAGYSAKQSFFISLLIVLIAGICTPAEAKSVYAITNHAAETITAYQIQGNQLGFLKAQSFNHNELINVTVDSQQKLLFVTVEGGGIFCVDADTLDEKGYASTSCELAGIVADELSQKIYAVGRETDQLYIYTWNGNAFELIDQVTLASLGSEGAYGIALDKVSRRLYVANNTAVVHYYDVDDPQWALLGTRNVGHKAMDIDVDLYHGYLYVGGYQEGGSGEYYLIKHNLRTEINPNQVQDVGTLVVGVAVDSISGLVYVTTWDFHVRAYDCSSYPFVQTYSQYNGAGPAGICVESSSLIFTKDDDLDDENPSDCRSPEQELTYTICWENTSGQTLTDAYIVDILPAGVDYDVETWFDPNTWEIISSDPNYDDEMHTYTWSLGTLDPNDSGCVQLTVTVNTNAAPGSDLHNVAELWADILVPDPNDPNSFHQENCLIAEAPKDTRVCCWMDMPEELFVDKNAPDGGNGLGWDTAYNDLQDALEYARSAVCGEVESIYVAQETYSPGDDEGDSFILPANISLYGGFPTGGCDFSLRNPKKYVTTLSGKIDDTHRTNRIATLGDNTLLSGFIVSEASRDGAGIFASGGDLGIDFIVEYCTIEQNGDYGAYIENSNATFRWTTVRNNDSDGIYHEGEGYTLTVENCWLRQNMRNGVYCGNSTPTIINSVITESDMAMEGRAGVMLFNPASTPRLQNLTIAHNKTMGIGLMGSRLPELQNCIVYHNGGSALAGFTADQAASYCCIEDCNSVNSNISVDPEFAYFDPNNVRIMATSPCHDSGLTLSENYSQKDMDDRDRVLGIAVDRGAYEIECEDTSNSMDWNADGLINLYEFNFFSKAWLAHDPNEPGLADPNMAANWNPQCNLDATDGSTYEIDLADLMVFLGDAPWLWKACWLDLEELEMQQMSSGSGESMLTLSSSEIVTLSADEGMAKAVIPVQAEIQSDSMAESEALLVVEEKPVTEQIADLQDSITFLESLWSENTDIQQTIDPNDWQEFMDSVSQSLLELQIKTVQIE
jgi:uncharacterized repeat protein (TIGR01451 family)